MAASRASLVFHSPVEHQGFPNLPADAVYGIERRHWFLENDADMAAADAVHVRLFCLNQVAVLEQNLPVQKFSPWAGAAAGRWTWP